MKTFIIVTQIRKKNVDAETTHSICSTNVETIAVQIVYDLCRIYEFHQQTLNLFNARKINLYDSDGNEIEHASDGSNPQLTVAIIEKIPEELAYLKKYYEIIYALYDEYSGSLLDLKPEYNFLGTIAKIEYIRANFQIETVEHF